MSAHNCGDKYVLGLDLGPSSVGWAAIKVDERGRYAGFMELADKTAAGKTVRIPAIGVRVFPAGVDNFGQGQKEEPRNRKRRASRGLRRRLRRARGRRKRVLALLQQHGLAPGSSAELAELQKADPYELRARGISEQLKAHEMGRVILHMAKRRGFKSNRKGESKDDDRGKLKEGMGRLAGELGDKTLGQFWSERLRDNRLGGIRNKGGGYQWVAQRGQYRDEFRRIWAKQRSYDSEVLTDVLRGELEKMLEKEMLQAADNLDFERAAKLRDELTKLRETPILGQPGSRTNAHPDSDRSLKRGKKKRRKGRLKKPKF